MTDLNKNNEDGKNLPTNQQKIRQGEEELATNLQLSGSKETGEIFPAHLLNKPSMTTKDKEGMQKVIDHLTATKMNSSENFKKLDTIVYTQKFIDIGGVKRSRDDISIEPNGTTISQYDGVTYFKPSQQIFNELNIKLAQQGMQIPTDSDYDISMKNLPNYREQGNNYPSGMILGFITGMGTDGYVQLRDNRLVNKGKSGCRLTSSPWNGESYKFRVYTFFPSNGELYIITDSNATPIRPIFKL